MLESNEEAFEGFGVLRSLKANSYRIFNRPWSSRKNVYFKLTTATSLTAPTRTLRIRIFVFLCTRGKVYFFKLQTLTADISRNSFMYSNTFENYDFNYVTDH